MKDKNSPKIRFPRFSGEWEQMKLGEVVEIKDSARISNTLWLSKGVPYLRSSDLANDEIAGELFISDDTYQAYKDKTGAPQKDDVLFTSGGKIGVTYHKIDDNPVYVQGGSILYAKTSTSDKLSGIYLKAFFSSPKMTKYIEGASTGLTIKHFTLKPAKAAPIFISSLEEQNKIGEFFKQIDDTIAFHQQELITLKQTRQGFLQKMFPKEGESVPEIRFPGFTGDWTERKLINFIDKVLDFRGKSPAKFGMKWGNSGYLVLSALNVKNGYIDKQVEAKYGDQMLFERWMGKERLEKGDVVFTTEAPMGNVAQVPDDNGYILNQRAVAFKTSTKKADNNFLAQLLRTPLFQAKLKANASGGTAKGIGMKEFAKMSATIPVSVKEQIKIGNFFQKLDNTIVLHQRELDALKETKKAFLQKMFV